MGRDRRNFAESLLLLCILTFGLIPLLISAAAAMAVGAPPLSIVLAAERSRATTPGAVTAGPTIEAPTETPTSTSTAPWTPTRTATRGTPITRSPVPPTSTSTRAVTPSRTPTATPCPPLQARLDARAGRNNTVTLVWSSSGGCERLSGEILARYVGEDAPYETYRLRTLSRGAVIDSPPLRCEGTFRVVYTMSLRDGSGQTVSRIAQSSVTWIC